MGDGGWGTREEEGRETDGYVDTISGKVNKKNCQGLGKTLSRP